MQSISLVALVTRYDSSLAAMTRDFFSTRSGGR
jgi:hypothetical protein